MGTGRFGAKHSSSVSGNGGSLTTKNARKYGIEVKTSSFTRNSIPRDRLNEGLGTINTIIKFLGLPASELPQITVRASNALEHGTIGCCSLGGMLSFNPWYFDSTNSTNEHAGTFAHEYAHALEAMLIHRNLTRIVDQANAWQDSLFAKGIVSRALTKMGESTDSWKSFAGKVSNYAKTDHSECLAEVCKEFALKGKNSSRFVQEVMKVFRSELRHKK